jgi:hypothetical protein
MESEAKSAGRVEGECRKSGGFFFKGYIASNAEIPALKLQNHAGAPGVP